MVAVTLSAGSARLVAVVLLALAVVLTVLARPAPPDSTARP